MAKNVEVLVEDISRNEFGQIEELNGTLRELSYQSFLYLNANPDNPRYKLIGELKPGSLTYNDDGSIKSYELVEGSPNLEAQHRPVPQRRSAEAVVNGPTQRENELLAEIARLKAAQILSQATVNTPDPPVQNGTNVQTPTAKKPGPKKKEVTLTEHVG